MTGKSIYNLLSNDATVSATVSTRIYPDVAPQNAAFPFIVYTKTSTEPTKTKEGTSPLDVERFQIDAYTVDYGDTQTLVAAIRSALDNKSGTIAGNVIDQISFEGEGSGEYIPDLDIWWVSQDYDVRLKR